MHVHLFFPLERKLTGKEKLMHPKISTGEGTSDMQETRINTAYLSHLCMGMLQFWRRIFFFPNIKQLLYIFILDTLIKMTIVALVFTNECLSLVILGPEITESRITYTETLADLERTFKFVHTYIHTSLQNN
jgi:hypothetical protein